MLSNNEKKIISFINYLPFLVLVCLLFLISIMYIYNMSTYKKDIDTLKQTFIEENKKIINSEVNRVYQYIVYEKSNSEERLKESIQKRVDEVHVIITAIYNKYKNKESKEQIKQRIRDILKNYRYNDKRGYFYINNLDGFNILHPFNSSIEGTNIRYIKDKRGNFPVIDSINALKNKDNAFTTVYWAKENDLNNEYKKINYNKVFKPYGWFIGTGEYVVDFEKTLKSKILTYISSLRYSKNGYVMVIDYEGNYLAHLKKNYLGLNRINLVDKNGVEITKEIIKTAKKGEGYIIYMGTIKPEPNIPSPKTTYIKGFQDWNWAIASGFYHYELTKKLESKELDLYNKNKKELINLLSISLIFIIAFTLFSLYISRLLKKEFIRYKKEVLQHIENNRKKDIILAQQSKMAAMGEMLQNIAHQWRQPLSLISTLSTGVKLNKEYGLLNEDNLIDSMDRINDSTKYLSQTIEDFRDFFMPNKKRMVFNLNAVIKKSIKLLELQFIQKNIEVLTTLDNIEVYGYENELIQVIINICNNSKDELIKSSLDRKLILIRSYVKDKKVFITIKDNAGGIRENIIDRIFEPYFTTKHKSLGTGIGLYMSQQIIVKHMKGSIDVKNTTFLHDNIEYKGAFFTITLDLD